MPAEQPTAPRQKAVRQSLEDHAPWKPAPYELVHATALQALARGEATPEQQRLALDWILYGASALRDEPYRPGGLDGDRDTVFALGKANVGRQIAKLMTLDIARLRHRPEADASEPKS